jgi:hypothetical protein
MFVVLMTALHCCCRIAELFFCNNGTVQKIKYLDGIGRKTPFVSHNNITKVGVVQVKAVGGRAQSLIRYLM